MVMSKSTPPVREDKGLGKGLGHLLNGDKVVGVPRHSGARAPKLGRGMETLVSVKEPEEARDGKKVLLPAWFFFTADLLLFAFTVAILFDAPRPMAGRDILLSAGLVGAGCLLGLLGLAQALEQLE